MTAGSAPAFSATFGSNNRMVGYSYDNNRNQLTTPEGATLGYDADNRMTTYSRPGVVYEYYEYHAAGWRVWKARAPATLYLHGPGGQLLCSYSDTGGGTYTEPISFAGRLVYTFRGGTDASGNLDYDTIRTDRLGSTRAVNGVARNYYPFGEEIGTPTANDQYKFASTYRDSTTGLDYAVNRYYASGTARFLTPDPYQASGGPSDPHSWNRYAYTRGDPVNRADPTGLQDCPSGLCSFYTPIPSLAPSSGLGGGSGGDGSGMEVVAGDPPGGEVTGVGGGADCNSLAAQALPGMTVGIAERVASLAPGNSGLQALIAFTWWAESRFSYGPQNYVNGKDKAAAIEEGNVDIGPMQINYKTWIGEVSSQYNADPEGLISPSNVFGTNTGAGAFNGLPEANLQFGAQILSGLYGKYGDAAAGYYRAGEGTWVQTPAGQAAYSKRQDAYNASKDQLKSFFASSCNRF